MTQRETDERYMQRCLLLALNGFTHTRPNPMVGAVVVAEGRIIGEGFHKRYGEAHAEVNAFAAIKSEDEYLLPQATVYVSLEPCAHYGKTPPCADLIVEKGVRRVVVGCVDTFSKVHGAGIRKLQEAGIEVTTGVLEDRCRWINRRFFTFHEARRPYIILKWAQTADGFMDEHGRPIAISTPFTRMAVHKLRASEEAIAVGRVTDEREHPRLDTRHWTGASPHRFVISHSQGIDKTLQECYENQWQSIIIEGGKTTLQSFIDCNLWDEIRIETNPTVTVGGGTEAPQVPENAMLFAQHHTDGNTISHYERSR